MSDDHIEFHLTGNLTSLQDAIRDAIKRGQIPPNTTDEKDAP